MRKLSWNVRGAGRKVFKNQIKELTQIHNSDIIILTETNVSSNKGQTIIQNITLPNYVKIHSKAFLEESSYYGDIELIFT